jgi:glycerate 2-kinase
MARRRLLIAPQEFKGTLTAVEAAGAIAQALRAAFPDWQLDVLPMADGGPGTTEALVSARGGSLRTLPAHDPHMRWVEASYGLLPGGRAVVECAAASGLLRLRPDELTPEGIRTATSFGTGELIGAALEQGAREIIVGLGGSGTNDGGAGMAQALGFKLLDKDGSPLMPGGAALGTLDRIDRSGAQPELGRVRCLGATDVTNPLCGPEGASVVYGPQKGAGSQAIEELDAALGRLAEVIERDLGVSVRDVAGAGAAGGLGAGVIAFLGGELRSGAQVIGEAASIEARVRACDVLITGEGRLDGQTVFGKTPAYLAGLAAAAGRRVVCVAGSLGEGYESAIGMFDAIEVPAGSPGRLPTGAEAAQQVSEAAVRVLNRLVGGGIQSKSPGPSGLR